jgi:hypothetical protein
MEAWFKESDIIASSGHNNGSKIHPLASKHAAYRMVSSVPKNSAIFLSSVL